MSACMCTAVFHPPVLENFRIRVCRTISGKFSIENFWQYRISIVFAITPATGTLLPSCFFKEESGVVVGGGAYSLKNVHCIWWGFQRTTFLNCWHFLSGHKLVQGVNQCNYSGTTELCIHRMFHAVECATIFTSRSRCSLHFWLCN